MKVLHFGAGKIGRGLIYPLLAQQHDVILADRNADLVRSVRLNKGYCLIELDYDGPCTRKITDPDIRTFSELAGINDRDVITTAVLVSNLPSVAPFIAAVAIGNKRPLYIIPMENCLEAAAILRNELKKILHNIDGIFFLRSVIDKIVPSVNGLDLECEKYESIAIEDRDGFGAIANDERLLSGNIDREFDKKFMLVNGLHACAAYLGHQRGHQHICDVMADKALREKFYCAGKCYIQYLIKVYGCREQELVPYFNTSLLRFSNPAIKDPLHRVGRNLMIKLAPGDRIVRPLLYNKQHGLSYETLEEVVDAARSFTIANDYDEYWQHLNGMEPRAVVNG